MRRKLQKSFHFAIQGILYTFKTQRNMRIHTVAAIISVLAGFFFQISGLEWLAMIIVIAFVLILEVMNTAIETLVDLYTEEYHQLAKVAKDTAAGAVLIAAIMSICVGLIIFLPKIIDYF